RRRTLGPSPACSNRYQRARDARASLRFPDRAVDRKEKNPGSSGALGQYLAPVETRSRDPGFRLWHSAAARRRRRLSLSLSFIKTRQFGLQQAACRLTEHRGWSELRWRELGKQRLRRASPPRK